MLSCDYNIKFNCNTLEKWGKPSKMKHFQVPTTFNLKLKVLLFFAKIILICATVQICGNSNNTAFLCVNGMRNEKAKLSKGIFPARNFSFFTKHRRNYFFSRLSRLWNGNFSRCASGQLIEKKCFRSIFSGIQISINERERAASISELLSRNV